jgi:hypothetical protein
MKACTLLVLLFIVSLFSCSKEDQKELTANNQQKWELVKMKGSMINSETTGANMAWQEYYIFNADGTFIKSREKNGQIEEAKGTYAYVVGDNEKSLALTFNSGYGIMGNCYSGLAREDLRIISSTKMLGTWEICDGPGLEYQLVGQLIVD